MQSSLGGGIMGPSSFSLSGAARPGRQAKEDHMRYGHFDDAAGEYVFSIAYYSPDDRSFDLAVDGGKEQKINVKGTGGKISTVNVTVALSAGIHSVRLSNAAAWMPDIDRMTLLPAKRD